MFANLWGGMLPNVEICWPQAPPLVNEASPMQPLVGGFESGGNLFLHLVILNNLEESTQGVRCLFREAFTVGCSVLFVFDAAALKAVYFLR